MTVETFTPAPTYAVQGVGPYAIPFPYAADEEIAVAVEKDGVASVLTLNIEYTVSPAAGGDEGAVTLVPTAANTWAGGALTIERTTAIEQGWAAQGGERELGLEVQLDRLTRAIQDRAQGVSRAFAALSRCIRIPEGETQDMVLPADATRAGKLLGFGSSGELALAPSPFVVDAGQLTFRTLAELELADIPDEVQTVEILGRWAPGDGGNAIGVKQESEPSAANKGRSANGNWFELLAYADMTPQHFGARYDGVTDDTAAINAWASYLRANRLAGRLPPGVTYCAGTLYLGSCLIRGCGGPANTATFASRTLIRSDGNPMISMGPGETKPQTLFLTQWEDFAVVAAGGAVSPIELWDRLAYPYQIGLWVGRNHNFMQTVAGGEASVSGGSGGLILRSVCVEDASGWGVYTYKLWGKSHIDNLFLRRCGGRAAFELGDDRLGGAIFLNSVTVETRWTNIHGYFEGHPEGFEDWDCHGCGLRVGAIEAETDLMDRLWQTGSYASFWGVHFERVKIGFCFEATKGLTFDAGNISGPSPSRGIGGGVCYLGYGAVGDGDLRVELGTWKITDIEDIYCTHQLADLGSINNVDSTPCTIHYWDRISVRTLRDQLITLKPRGDVSSMPFSGGAGSRALHALRPFADNPAKPAHACQNHIAAFSTSGAPATLGNGWSVSGGTLGTVTRRSARIRDGAELVYSVTDCEPGELYTFMAWVDLPGSHILSNDTFTLTDDADATLQQNNLGSSGGVDDAFEYYAVQVEAPASGTIKVKFRNDGTNNVDLLTPILVPGALREMSPLKAPSGWMAADALLF